ncbi:MAG: cytochrome-c peroxidase [Leptospiraceae bacterium]|nr:cytochrome-c peroxidase [Leptospiraceae bacterium]MCP5496270.1 cytochrome-c peroxidase [Leptospiraceae bacterium]
MVFKVIPDKMPDAEKDTKALVDLGRKLYFEKKLSANNNQSCNACHDIENKRGGVDNLQTSVGSHGQNGGRNAPTVLNAGFHIAQFWDGRSPNLKEQAKGPILNPVEMAMPSEKAVEEKLASTSEYVELFTKAFPDAKKKITYDNLAHAIAAFERTLKTNDRFDDFMRGDFKALSKTELRGLETFLNTGCTNCHNGPLIGGNSYRKVGELNPYQTEDLGRYEVTKQESDKYFFKVPSLRNVALTAPYFHDGKIKTLDEAVKTMAKIQLNKDLKDNEVADIVAFLNALTDKIREK